MLLEGECLLKKETSEFSGTEEMVHISLEVTCAWVEALVKNH